jgi:hypothetical protein
VRVNGDGGNSYVSTLGGAVHRCYAAGVDVDDSDVLRHAHPDAQVTVRLYVHGRLAASRKTHLTRSIDPPSGNADRPYAKHLHCGS